MPVPPPPDPPPLPPGTVATPPAAPSRATPIVPLVALLFLTVAGYATLVVAFPPHVGTTLLLFVLFGGGGGVLFAVRENELRSPGFVDGGIQLGWISDGMFGVAGAMVIVLLIPGLSENAPALVRQLHEEKQNHDRAVKEGGPVPAPPPDARKSGTDLLELAAIALIGGFGGRSVLKRATNQVLQEKVQKVEQAQQKVEQAQQTIGLETADLRRDLDASRQKAAQLEAELAQSRANSAVLELVAVHLTPGIPSHTRDEIRQALERATSDGRVRVFQFTMSRFKSEPKAMADGVTTVLQALLDLDRGTLDKALRAALEEVTDRRRPADAEAVAAARQAFDSAPPPKPKPAPAATRRTRKR